MNKDQLTEIQIRQLRTSGLLQENEYAYRAGDLIIAENPVTGEKRVITQNSNLNENNRRVLKG